MVCSLADSTAGLAAAVQAGAFEFVSMVFAAWQHLVAHAALLLGYLRIVLGCCRLFDFVIHTTTALKVIRTQSKEASGQLLLATRALLVRLIAKEALHLSCRPDTPTDMYPSIRLMKCDRMRVDIYLTGTLLGHPVTCQIGGQVMHQHTHHSDCSDSLCQLPRSCLHQSSGELSSVFSSDTDCSIVEQLPFLSTSLLEVAQVALCLAHTTQPQLIWNLDISRGIQIGAIVR